MAQVTIDANGKLKLPAEFLSRRHISADTEYWLDQRNGDLILHPRRPDARKLYIEPTTSCKSGLPHLHPQHVADAGRRHDDGDLRAHHRADGRPARSGASHLHGLRRAADPSQYPGHDRGPCASRALP